MAQYHRTSTDQGLAGTLAWIAKWYGDIGDLRVARVCIDAQKSMLMSDCNVTRLKSLKRQNESELHASLKYAARVWLEVRSSHPDTIEHEVLCYSPIDELCEGRTILGESGEEFDIRSPQILYDNIDGFPLSCGHAIRIDLHPFDTSVEVGGTSPFNLLTPLLDGLVNEAVWLPYPSGATPNGFRLTDHDLGTVDAYSVTFR